MKRVLMAGLVLVAAMALASSGMAYQIPFSNSNVKYFYVFGEDGDPLMGAEDSKMEVFIDVPADEPGDVTIQVYDPDTGGFVDWRKPNNDWNTRCKYELYGSKLLETKEFGIDPEYDKKYYTFGPYKKTQGEKVGDYYRFRLVVTGLVGDDQNLFKVKISPNSAESFSEDITFRLLPNQGDLMYFYPEVPAGTESITVGNYDLDVNGGTSTLAVTSISKKYRINDSESGEWRETIVPIETETGGRLVYTITKATQRYANAGVKMKTDKGKKVPIYFRKGAPPVAKEAPAPKPKTVAPKPVKPAAKKLDLKCNKFTFDATQSYDVDRQKLSFLWDFGDGETSTEPVVTHIYEKGGEYTVTLTVKDSSGLPCDTGATSQKIYVNTPPVADFTAPMLVCAGSSVTLDARGTKDDTPEKLIYMWNFGDGNKGAGERVTHTYEKGGKYNITLTVDDSSGTECAKDTITKQIRVNTKPVAHAGKDITMCLKSFDDVYKVHLDGSASRDADGNKLTYTWDLGDGAIKEGERITHTYATGGVYNVTLKVDDGLGLPCSTDTDSLTVNLNKTPIANAGKDKKACTGSSVSFSGGDSETETGETLSYKWSFGDGAEAEGVNVRHTYEKGGKYMVTLTVDDGKGTPCSKATDVISVDVNSRPIADLKDVKDTCVGKRISFDASSSKDPDGGTLSYTWNFGDGTVEKGSSRMSHEYKKGGNYNVSVTVDDGKDSSCSTSSATIKVKVNTPPKAVLNMVKACCVDMEQKFDASSSSDPDGDKLTYTWDFGDGSTAQGAKVSHAYKEPGVYKVVLKVDDGSATECSADYVIEEIKVNAKPVPVIKIR